MTDYELPVAIFTLAVLVAAIALRWLYRSWTEDFRGRRTWLDGSDGSE